MTSEDTGAYGIDKGQTIVDLLKVVSECVSGDGGDGSMIRLGMTNPPYILQHLDAIATFLRQPNVFSFIHIPVQSGSDHVLKAMQRQYTVENFVTIVDALLEAVPGLTIATDIIVGFGEETKEDHEATMHLLQKYEFAIVNISKFFPRPGTPAARMPHVPSTVVKPRSTELSLWFKSIRPYDRFLRPIQMVWVGSERNGSQMVGHTKAYVKVLLPLEEGLQGTRVLVRIVETSRFHIVGEVVDRHPAPLEGFLSPEEIAEKVAEEMRKSGRGDEEEWQRR